MKPPSLKYGSENANAFSRSGVALIPAAIISILPDCVAGINASNPMLTNSNFKPNRLATSSLKSTSKPIYLLVFSSANSNGGNVVSEPTFNTPAVCVNCASFLSLPQPASKPTLRTAVHRIRPSFFMLIIITSQNIFTTYDYLYINYTTQLLNSKYFL